MISSGNDSECRLISGTRDSQRALRQNPFKLLRRQILRLQRDGMQSPLLNSVENSGSDVAEIARLAADHLAIRSRLREVAKR